MSYHTTSRIHNPMTHPTGLWSIIRTGLPFELTQTLSIQHLDLGKTQKQLLHAYIAEVHLGLGVHACT